MTEKEKNAEQITEISVESTALQDEAYSKLNNKVTEPLDNVSEKPRKATARKRTSSKKKCENGETAALKEKTSDDTEDNNEAIDTEIDLPVASDFESEAEDISEGEVAGDTPDLAEEILIPIFDIPQKTEPDVDEDTSLLFDEPSEILDSGIVPPDMLFANMQKETDEIPIEPTVDEENEAIEIFYSDEAEAESEIRDDAQYTIDDIVVEEKEKPEEKYDPKKPRKVDSRFDFVELFVFTLVAVMILMSFFFRHSIVNGASMENTLHNGEHLIISDFFYTPKRGDVIVCEDHTTKLKYPIVKRVIAVGGDKIEIKEDGVYVNGVAENATYVYTDNPAYKYDPMPEFEVPKGQLFVMGDHRDNSTDSRDQLMLGTVSEDSVLGKVLLRFYPFDKFGTID